MNRQLMRNIGRGVGVFFECLFFLLIALLFLMNFQTFQTKFVNYGIDLFVEEEGTEMDVEGLNVSLNGDIIIKNFSLKVDGYSVDVDEVKVDLSYADLMIFRLRGHRLDADGVVVRKTAASMEDTTSEEDDPFRFKDMPRIRFKDVEITNIMYLDATYPDIDTFRLDRFQAKDLAISDSLYIRSAHCTGANVTLVNDSKTEEPEVVEERKPLEQKHVPHIQVDDFKLDRSNLVAYNLGDPGSLRTLSDIHVELKEYSNFGRGDFSLDHISFVYQDTMPLAYTGDGLELQNGVFDLEDLEVDSRVLTIDLKKFMIEDGGERFDYTADIRHLRVSPRISFYLPIEHGIITTRSPDLYIECIGEYKNDSLSLSHLALQYGPNNAVSLSGTIGSVSELGNVKVRSNEVGISIPDLKEYLNIEMHPLIERSVIRSFYIDRGYEEITVRLGVLINGVEVDLSTVINDFQNLSSFNIEDIDLRVDIPKP